MSKTSELIKSWRIWFLICVILLAAFLFIFTGVRFGIDFEGGTMFQIHLAEKVDNIEEVSNIIESRLNWSGLQDVRVYATEGEFIFVVVRQTEPEEVKRIESLIKKQGRFEVLIDGNVMFTGSDLVAVDQDPNIPSVMKLRDSYQWQLPFVLSIQAAKRFRDLAFHKCTPIVLPSGEADYECAYTYFFIDRPTNSVVIISKETFENDKAIFLSGTAKIPQGIAIEEMLENIGTDVLIVDKALSEEQLAKLKSLTNKKKYAIVDASLQENVISAIEKMGFKVKTVEAKKDEPWLYTVSGLKSIVRLRPSITGNDPYVERKEDAKIFTELQIVGSAPTKEDAAQERSELKILLNSGALPVSVESISHYWTSPTQGKEFLFQTVIVGLIVLIAVSAVIFLRYKHPLLSAAIVFTAIVEAFVTTSFTSALGQSLDLATLAGVIAAVGTGVDDQIVITDELLRGRDVSKEATSLLRRVKRAFFIVIAAAATTLATMVPIILFGFVLVKIVGFAFAITIGVLVGIFVTRPAYGEIARYILAEY